jgi:uncharacterized membrane protein
MNASTDAAAGASAIVPERAAPAMGRRQGYVDVFRGLLIAHMALDHASLIFNTGRGAEELASAMPPVSGDLLQFLTRFTGVPVAPGFFFMAGFMVALTSLGRAARGVSDADITRRLVIRGLVLLAVDAVVMGLPRVAMGFYSFAVLSCLGASLILLALLRHWRSAVLLPLALGVVFLHPMLDLSALPLPLRALLHEPVRTGAFRSLYPMLPWCAIVVLGFVVGRDAREREHPAWLWLWLGLASLAVFFVARFQGWGNAYPHDGLGGRAFWTFAKYPPDVPFLAWALTIVFLALALVWHLTRQEVPTWLRPFEVFGRVPFFFYVTHFYVLGIASTATRLKGGLGLTYAVWLLLLLAMVWPCARYWRKKRERPNLVTRYF